MKNVQVRSCKWMFLSFQKSLSVWPCVNIMSSVSSDSCEACSEVDSAKLALFYGQPYDEITLKPRDDSEKQAPNKVFAKIWFFFFFLNSKFQFWLVTKSWNHHSFVNISPTLVIDTSIGRSSRVLHHGNPKIWIS